MSRGRRPPRPAPGADLPALRALVAVAARLDAAARIAPPMDDALLGAIAATAALVLDAQAASIALVDPASDQLVFRAAAGPAAGDVVGLRIDAAAGIAGYAFSTGQPLAVADVSVDPRFDRSVAEATGYVPASILAAPLADDDGVVGVLEVLDRRGGTFSLRDLDVAGALAREATAIVRSGRTSRDAVALLRGAMLAVATADGAGTVLDDAAVDDLVSAVTRGLPDDPDDPVWQLADRIARIRVVDPDMVALAVDWLDALLRRAEAAQRDG